MLVILFSFFTIFINVNIVNATVGGPTYIGIFKYNKANESVYYTKFDHGGRGCPPELIKKSLIDEKEEIVYSCEQGEKIVTDYYKNNKVPYDYNTPLLNISNKISEITNDFKYLSTIDLNKNNITIDIKFIKTEKSTYDTEFNSHSTFNATIYQNGKKIKEQIISGCYKDQPFTFAGYAIPGFDKKIVMLVSGLGNCYEGGYVNESIFIVGELDKIKRDSRYSYYKEDSPLIPETLTLYANDNVQDINNNQSTSTNQNINQNIIDNTQNENKLFNKTNIITTAIAILTLFIGFIIGRLIKK